MSPEKALADAIEASVWLERQRFPKPGQIIQMLSKEAREALENLTSDRLAKIRVDSWELPGPPPKGFSNPNW